MKKGIEILLIGLMMVSAVSCTEEYVIDVEEGERMIGVEAYFSDEMKQHEVILSYTAVFYNTDEIQMISGQGFSSPTAWTPYLILRTRNIKAIILPMWSRERKTRLIIYASMSPMRLAK